jgi:hypothetical protein
MAEGRQSEEPFVVGAEAGAGGADRFAFDTAIVEERSFQVWPKQY